MATPEPVCCSSISPCEYQRTHSSGVCAVCAEAWATECACCDPGEACRGFCKSCPRCSSTEINFSRARSPFVDSIACNACNYVGPAANPNQPGITGAVGGRRMTAQDLFVFLFLMMLGGSFLILSTAISIYILRKP